MMVFLFFKIGQFLWEISPVFTVDLNIAKIVALSENSDLSYVFPSAKCEQNSNAQVVVANKQALCLNELTDLYEILHAVQGNVTLQGDVLKNLL